MKDKQFWFLVGSQHLYGEETLRQVAAHAERIAKALNDAPSIPCGVTLQPVLTTPDDILQVMRAANQADDCLGVICWMHTFSPSKMWINGFATLQKPYCHLHTQFNRQIPDEGIDMDFMNLNQSAHGDREHGFIAARMRLARKIVVGYWEDEDVQVQIGNWMRSCVGVHASRRLKVMRFGDNMRQVAVTEGDKVETQIKLGWQVNTTPVGDLVEAMGRVTPQEIDAQVEAYRALYDFPAEGIEAIRYQAHCECGMKKLFEAEGCMAFTNTFEDLHGMQQLPGLATQHLMASGYGYGGEGDWKTAGLTSVMKAMAEGLPGGTSFMEDYTYDLTAGQELVLGAHMLEVCPTIAADKPRIEVHPLGIGGKNDPARVVFEGAEGPAICVSLIDMGGRLRMIVQDVMAVKPIYKMPNLPVARVMWKPLPDLKIGAHAWILAGGAHHTTMSFALDAGHMRDFAEIMDIEFVHIGETTELDAFRHDLFLADLAWKLK